MSITSKLVVAVVALPAVIVGCGSGTGSGSGGATGTGSHGSSVTASSATTASSSGSGAVTSSGATGATSSSSGGGSCISQCETMHPSEFLKFESYELKECGCAASSPCMPMCTTADCMATMPSQVSQACQTCLQTEAAKTTSSSCTVKAGLTDCSNDPTCKPFFSCALCCGQGGAPC